MKNVSAAHRYAQAAYNLARAQKALPQLTTQAAVLAQALADDTLAEALANPALGRGQRLQLVNTLARAANLHPVLHHTLGVVATNNRLAMLPDILTALQTLADSEAGIARVQVQAASALSDKQKTALKAQVKQALKAKDVVLEETLMPQLMAGFRAFFGGMAWDASMLGNLQRLKARLHHTVNNPINR